MEEERLEVEERRAPPPELDRVRDDRDLLDDVDRDRLALDRPLRDRLEADPRELERVRLELDRPDDFFRRWDFVSPFSARILLTVRAATSSARPPYLPDFLALCLMCLYCRSRFGLAPAGIDSTSLGPLSASSTGHRWLR